MIAATPSLVAGDMEITFEEWVAPTLGQRSRDPIEAPDGSIWWSGMWADLAVRVDPATGEIREYALPTGTQAHTVTTDAEGGIWFTGNGNGTVGRLDPATGESTVYKMPDPKARDPHSAIVDANGTLWFTLQGSNMIGRLVPATGAIDLVTPPTPGSRPYDIELSAEGVPWVAANGSNRLIRVDPVTMEITDFELPDPATTVRRLAFASDGTIWYVNSSPGPARPARSRDRRGPGMGFTERPALASLCDRGDRRHRLVQRIRHAPRRPRPLRPGDRDLPELADPVRQHLRRHRAPHAVDRGGRPADSPEQHQPRHAGGGHRGPRIRHRLSLSSQCLTGGDP